LLRLNRLSDSLFESPLSGRIYGGIDYFGKNDVERVGYLIGECKNMGIEVLAPEINESYHGFTVIPGTNKIRFGLSAIKNVGENLVNEIVAVRKAKGPFSDIFDFMKRIDPKKLTENL